MVCRGRFGPGWDNFESSGRQMCTFIVRGPRWERDDSLGTASVILSKSSNS
jgi:hypothetical protein